MSTTKGPRPHQPSWWVMLAIRAYRRFLSPVLGRNCRYLPTCSAYSHDAVARFGTIKGGWLAVKRIGRCHPFHDGGYDPVPAKRGHA